MPGISGQKGQKGIKGQHGMAGPQGPKGTKGRLLQPPLDLITPERGPPGDQGIFTHKIL